jgi:predicted MPP superfamily phosphohydrolase
MNLALVMLALLGHAFFWVGLVNRLHSTNLRRPIVKRVTLLFFACAAVIPLGIGWCYVAHCGYTTQGLWDFIVVRSPGDFFVTAYCALCWAVAPITLVRWIYMSWAHRTPAIVRFHGRKMGLIDPKSAAADAGELAHHWLPRLPWNESLQLDIAQWALDIPRLPPSLDGLSIAHLSDVHLTGLVGKAYFREVVRIANEQQPDLICLTGDLVDETKCIPWIADTLGQLKAKYGVYFILGNHDLRVKDVAHLRRELRQCGLVDLGGRWQTIDVRDTRVIMAGDERPWFYRQHNHPNVQTDRHACLPLRDETGPLRIGLAHGPDQLAWARSLEIDLLLVGHTHGGQIRIPPLGAIFSPTAAGVKYVSGVFHLPPTILHVSRGVSSQIPLRWNCRPEVAMLALRTCK